MLWIVDGYNLLHRGWPHLLREGDLESARAEIEARLQRFQSFSKASQIILVFDGKEGVYSKRRPKPGFRVVFSRPPRSADDVILDFCREREARDKVRVVTSDFRDIASRASGLRFVPVTSEEFAQEVDRVLALSRGGGSDRTPDEKPRRPSGRDTDLWLREFGMEEENGW